MAVSFGLRLSSVPSRERLEELAGARLAGGDGLVWIPGVSTRGISTGSEGGLWVVRVQSCAAPEELVAAMRIVVGLAREAGGAVVMEGGGEVPVAEFEAAHDEAWARRRLSDDVEQLRKVAATQTVALGGPVRVTQVGPGVLARVDGPDALLGVMRAMQYPGDEWFVAEVLRVADEDTGRGVDVVVLGPGVDYFFPPAQVVAVIGGSFEDTGPHDAPVVHVPFGRLGEIVVVEPVDETAVRVRAVPQEEWAGVHQRAWVIGAESPFGLVGEEEESPARPDGTLLPVLRSARWVSREMARCRPLVAAAVPDMALVSWGIDTPYSIAVVPNEGLGDAETADLERLEAAAVRNLEALEIPWQDGPEGAGKRGLVATGEYAAELVLSEKRMKEAAERLGVGLLAVAVPVRGLIQVKVGEDVEGVRALVDWAGRVYEDAGKRENAPPVVTPVVFAVQGGKVVGVVRVGEGAGAAKEAGEERGGEEGRASGDGAAGEQRGGGGINGGLVALGVALVGGIVAAVWWLGGG